ncbi:MAG: YkgJ family cysteine cluster protein [Thermoanaerobaculia bacterium]
MTSPYRRILALADAHFDQVLRTQRGNLSCRVGCTHCCHGFFEIGAADVSIIAEALGHMPAGERDRLIRAARASLETTNHPRLRDLTKSERDAFLDSTEGLPCPALGADGACTIYDFRPLICRTFGLPIREGPRFLGEECFLNFTEATDDERFDAAWDLLEEDAVGVEDQYTVAEAIVAAARGVGIPEP